MANSVIYIIELRDRFSGEGKKLRKLLKGANVDVKTLDKSMKKIGTGMSRIGRSFSTRVSLPIIAGIGLITKEAIDSQETFSKFDAVFSDVLKKANITAKNISKDFGLSAFEAKKLLSGTGDLLVGFGFTGEAALGMSKQVNELAADLASFQNLQGGVTRASESLTKALLGERESIKSLGISILEEDVKARMKQLILVDKMKFASLRQAKAVATLQLAFEQSSKAVGDFNRTQDEAANKGKVGLSSFKDLRIAIGSNLLPTVIKFWNAVTPIIRQMTDWVENNKDLTKTFLKVALAIATIGPILIILGSLVGFLGLVAAGAAAIGVPFLAVVGVFGLISAAIVAVIFKFKELKNMFSSLKDFFNQKGNVIKLDTSEIKKPIIGDAEISGFSAVSDSFKTAFSHVFNDINKWIKSAKGFFDVDLSKSTVGIKDIVSANTPKSLGNIPGIDGVSGFSQISGPKSISTPTLSQVSPQQNKVDISGLLRVQAEQGTRVTKADIFNPNIGLNVAQGAF